MLRPSWITPGYCLGILPVSFVRRLSLRNGALAMCTEQGAVDIVSSGLDVEDVEARAHATMDPVPYFVCHIDCPFGQARAGLPASCIRAFPNGFAVAGADSCIAVWRQDKEKAGPLKVSHCVA